MNEFIDNNDIIYNDLDLEFNEFGIPIEQDLILTEDEVSISKITSKTKQDLVNNNTDIHSAVEYLVKEDILQDITSETVKVANKHQNNEENKFELERRKMQLELIRTEENKLHKYRMAQINRNGKHIAMLDKRKKIEEKYGYLYEKDENDQFKDFSYSKIVNILRATARNFDKLDKPIKTITKFIFFGSMLVCLIFLIKYFIV